MTELVSPGQLRASFLRWALVFVPGVIMLGYLSNVGSGGGASNAWFTDLAKPDLYPSSTTYMVVWTGLYALMAMAAVLVVTARGASGRAAAIGAFAVQLVLILAWSPVFFGMHRIQTALFLLFAIDAAVLVTVLLFRRVRPVAAALMLPCLAWLLFSTVLNWQLLNANRDADAKVGGGAAATVNFN
ncbi:MAG: tryptophan-rich sensory protein [Sphingomonadales bacterium]|nr:tryptophan-rich sensory protein [Sphingomonadales bacterium]